MTAGRLVPGGPDELLAGDLPRLHVGERNGSAYPAVRTRAPASQGAPIAIRRTASVTGGGDRVPVIRPIG
jgi:hypothetical protein